MSLIIKSLPIVGTLSSMYCGFYVFNDINANEVKLGSKVLITGLASYTGYIYGYVYPISLPIIMLTYYMNKKNN
jgi:hypothetical protein